jgi:hypothetical protein
MAKLKKLGFIKVSSLYYLPIAVAASFVKEAAVFKSF